MIIKYEKVFFMNDNLKKELLRKSLHLFTGVTFSLLILFGFLKWWHFLALFVFSLPILFYIHNTNKKVPVISYFIDKMGRQDEFPGKGALTFVIGVFIAFLIFPKNIAAASIMILAVGDAISPLIGKHFGKTKTIFSKRKMIEGFIVGVSFSFLAATLIVGAKLAFFASLIALFAEFWDETDFIDDNILIPLVAGLVMTVINLL